MSATDTIRAMLDERGVPWRSYGYENHTWWGEWHAENRPSVNGLFLKVDGVITPEQAIEATLGRGECREVENEFGFPTCSECGAGLPDDYTVYYCWNCGRKVRA